MEVEQPSESLTSKFQTSKYGCMHLTDDFMEIDEEEYECKTCKKVWHKKCSASLLQEIKITQDPENSLECPNCLVHRVHFPSFAFRKDTE